MPENNVCTTTVAQELCVGCGVCAGVCPHNNLVMRENQDGGYVPASLGHCMPSCSECLHVCPFQDHNVNEDSLGRIIYEATPGIHYRSEIGYFLNTYVGYVADSAHRWRGASGGIATWFLKKLLLKNIVDHVICVTPNPDPRELFAFKILSHPDEIIGSAKSAYYPVELSQAIQTVRTKPGRYALIGLPCFIKAVRLAALRNLKLRKRIVVYAGLTCGHLTTKGFAESLARRMGLDPEKVTHFCFRQKAPERPALNFTVTATGERASAAIEWNDFPVFAWMSGMFKLRSCNFCDDIFAELADISFMDAWLPEYSGDSAGTSLVITRSALAHRIIREDGIENGECILRDIPVERIIESQLGRIKNKREMLRYRLWIEARAGHATPQKRVARKRPNLLDWLFILNEEAIRKRSFVALSKQRQSGEPGLTVFMKELQRDLYLRKWLYRLRKENIKSGIKRWIDRVKKTILPLSKA